MPKQAPNPWDANEARLFDHLVLPALKLDESLNITYANEAAVALLGTTEVTGKSVFDFFGHTPMMDEQFRKRRFGEGDIYETEFARPNDGRRIPVSITGIPILDNNDRFVGSLGIIRSLEREKIVEAIQNHLQTQRNEVKLVELVVQELNKLVPFDYFSVSIYSQNLEHVSSWIRCSGETVAIGRRWWPISPHLRAQLREPIVVPDFLQYIRENWLESYKRDASVQNFIGQGYNSFLRIPIRDRDRIVASFSLFSKETAKYSRADIEQIKDLRIRQAIQMAIYYRNERKFQFRSILINDMIKLSTARELASRLAVRLAEEYEWHHVAIFRVCEEEKKFRLLAEAATEGTTLLPESNRERPFHVGVLGYVYESRRTANIPDVTSEDFSETFVPGWPDIRSELCLPIIWDDKVQWLLNAEDQRLQAFSKDEEQEVGVILEEAAVLLQRLSRQFLLESAFRSSSDAVLISDAKNKNILDANPAAAVLLGFKSSKRLHGSFKRLFRDERVAKRLSGAQQTHEMEVDLVRRDGTNVPVLISGVKLSDDISRNVFVAKNLTTLRRLEQLEELKKLFQEVALQTHTPLALANSWLENLSRSTADEKVVDSLPKILAQLKKLEITYDRLALLTADLGAPPAASRKQPLDIGVEIKRIIEEFPSSETNRIGFADPGELPYIGCDPGQISFMFASILSYLIRFSPCEKSIDIQFSCTEETISVIISGLLPPQESGSDAERKLARTRFEMALGEPLIQLYATNNSARYERKEIDGERTQFKIDFTLSIQETVGQ
jgi:PAS domain S-box-containing protein